MIRRSGRSPGALPSARVLLGVDVLSLVLQPRPTGILPDECQNRRVVQIILGDDDHVGALAFVHWQPTQMQLALSLGRRVHPYWSHVPEAYSSSAWKTVTAWPERRTRSPVRRRRRT